MSSKKQSFLCAICLICSIILNIYSALFGGGWTRKAAMEAEAVTSLSCSGHGRVFLDGLVLGNGDKPICECNACYGGPECSLFSSHDCMVDADSGDPMFLEPFWVDHAAESAVVVAGWHRMSYEFNDGSLISQELANRVRRVHDVAGNAVTRGRFVIFGAGATQLLHAAVHALSSADDSSFPSRVVASSPYYPVYREQTEFFGSEDYKFEGDTSMWKNNVGECSRSFIELVTSPNNPDGQLKKAVLEGPCVKTIHDLAYYWPHFTAIPSPVDEDVMIFSLSKLTGHAGSRFGWAIIKDEAIYQRMLSYMSLSTYGVSRETQLRALKLINVLLDEEEGRELFQYAYSTMKNRWTQLTAVLSKSKRFSIQDIQPHNCSFLHKPRGPSPAFAWIRCVKEEDKDCFEVLKEVNITGRSGTLFGVESRYVRLSLVKSQDDFNLLLQRIEMLVSIESHDHEDDHVPLIIPTPKHNDSIIGCFNHIHIAGNYEHARVLSS